MQELEPTTQAWVPSVSLGKVGSLPSHARDCGKSSRPAASTVCRRFSDRTVRKRA